MSTKPNPPVKPAKTVSRKAAIMSDGYTSGYWFLFDKQLDKPSYMPSRFVEQCPIAHLVTAGDSVQVEFDAKNPATITSIKLVTLAG
jgi:hypothetical protein